MKYTKPEVSLVERAVDAIHGSKPGGNQDFPHTEESASAYESDE
jgi:hypothetical protein